MLSHEVSFFESVFDFINISISFGLKVNRTEISNKLKFKQDESGDIYKRSHSLKRVPYFTMNSNPLLIDSFDTLQNDQ